MRRVALVRVMGAVLRRALNALNRVIAGYKGASAAFLIIANERAGTKVDRIIARLRYFVGSGELGSRVRVSRGSSLLGLLSARIVVEADEGLLASRYRLRFDHIFRVDCDRN